MKYAFSCGLYDTINIALGGKGLEAVVFGKNEK